MTREPVVNAPPAYLCVVLHAHLPFVRHPEVPEFLEERWLFEAVRECYLPLLRVLNGRVATPGAARFTLSISPTLLAMLDDDLLRRRIRQYLDRVATMAAREVQRTAGDARWHPLARYYEALSATNLDTWEKISGDIAGAMLEAGRQGLIELMTTAATHAFLPLWRRHPDAVRRQIETGVHAFARRAGHPPAGFWLPECGYYPGVEAFLADAGVRYFFLETHGILHASPPPRHGVYAPLICPNGVAAFGRDPASSRQVWSTRGGYPGDPDYREYYRDIGPTLPRDELTQIFPVADLDASTGFKYHRITGPSADKLPYHPGRAAEKAKLHAADFLQKKAEQAKEVAPGMATPPVFVAPYDAELFGHWWFEGPLFLEALLQLADRGGAVSMITPSDYLARHSGGHEAIPSASTWGAKGYSDVWLNEATAWMYPHLFRAATRAVTLEEEASPQLPADQRQRMVMLAHHELMHAQASDWPFMMNAKTHATYAEKRVRDHLARFYWLAGQLSAGLVNGERLRAIEEVDGALLGD